MDLENNIIESRKREIGKTKNTDLILGGPASVFKSLTIAGNAAADSYFAAGLFKSTPKIARISIPAATDPRFKLG